jgi:Protein of unknown function (DUF669)
MSDNFELPEPFDPGAHEGTRDLEPIPIGWYQAQIVESEVRDASNGNGNYLLAVFEILGGEYRGRKIFQNVTLQNTSQQACEIGIRLLTDIYTAVGHSGPTRDIRVLLFKPVMARVGIKRDEGGIYPDRNAISQVKPPDYQPKRGSGSGPSRTPPVTPKGPTSAPTSAAPSATSSGGSAPWR